MSTITPSPSAGTRTYVSPAWRRNFAALATTALFAAAMSLSGVLYLVGPRPLMEALHELGYPSYFLKLLGVAKLLGAVTLFAPRRARIREWAYAGFGFDLSFAIASHLAVGHARDVLPPLLALVLLGASYALRNGFESLGEARR
jgi:DoxX-like protein